LGSGETVEETVRSMVQSRVAQLVEERRRREREQDMAAVEQVAGSTVLGRMMAQVLMGVVGKRAEDLVYGQIMDVQLMRMMSGRCVCLSLV
jgi:hypothetical protein